MITPVPKKTRKFKDFPKTKKTPTKKLKKECDGLWSKIVRALDPVCIWCGKRAAIHAHHVFTRQQVTTRHVILNGASLCGGCHMRAHAHSALFTDFIKERMGIEIYNKLKEEAYREHGKINYAKIKQVLHSMWETIQASHNAKNWEAQHGAENVQAERMLAVAAEIIQQIIPGDECTQWNEHSPVSRKEDRQTLPVPGMPGKDGV